MTVEAGFGRFDGCKELTMMYTMIHLIRYILSFSSSFTDFSFSKTTHVNHAPSSIIFHSQLPLHTTHNKSSTNKLEKEEEAITQFIKSLINGVYDDE